MDLTSTATIKELLKKYNAKPFKGLGQNFLIDKRVLEKIIAAARLKKNDTVLEIGPGIGTLTQELARKVKKVIAIEKDRKLIQVLREIVNGFKNIKIIEQNVLKMHLIEMKNYKIVANLPYNIAAPVIRKFLEAENPPKEMILMVQKEVAQRICAKPPDMNLLAISVQFYSEPKILFYVSKNNFWPRPKVDGAVIKLEIKRRKREINKTLFFNIVRAAFSQPRKYILNNLSNMLKLNKDETRKWLFRSDIVPNQRAEVLNLRDWLRLTRNWRKNQ